MVYELAVILDYLNLVCHVLGKKAELKQAVSPASTYANVTLTYPIQCPHFP